MRYYKMKHQEPNNDPITIIEVVLLILFFYAILKTTTP